MLVIFYGTSCVGKTTLMRYLYSNYNWKIINTYMTRTLRENENEKIQISSQEMFQREENGEFLPINEYSKNYYATPIVELETAVLDEHGYWCLDYPIAKKNLLKPYKHCGIIILPENEEQLINQINDAGREQRKELILSEYNDIYKNYSETDFFKVTNNFNEVDKTSKKIIKTVNDYWRNCL